MKKIIVTISIITALITGCKKDFDPELYGVLSPSTFPSTPGEYELYTMEAYVPFEGKWGYTAQYWEYGFFSPEMGHIEMFDMSSDIMSAFTGWEAIGKL